MRLKLILTFVALLFIFLFPQEVKAEEQGSVYYADDAADTADKLCWRTVPVPLDGCFTIEQKAAAIFTRMFEGADAAYIPDDTRLLNAIVLDGRLFLNVSREIMNYGGTYYERRLVEQIVKTALDIDGVDGVTLLTEGKLEYLPEGGIIASE